jgi:predicted site-specific integrase-resolvase
VLHEAVGVLLVEQPGWLARLRVRVIGRVLAVHGVQVAYVGELEGAVSGGAEVVRGVLGVVTSFAGRPYGQRSAKSRRLAAVLGQELGAA